MALEPRSHTDQHGPGSAPQTDDSAPTAIDHPPVPAVTEPTVGDTIDRFEVLGTLGRGGMGLVLRALDPKLGRQVALKLVRRSIDPSIDARFRREAQAMAQLSHPNVLPIYDVGETEHMLFLAMELVEGQTLRQWCKSGTRSWQEVVARFLHAGRGLQAAHEAELIHRDFKPANVMLGDDGRIRVMDFGLARAIRSDSEPERWSGTSSTSLSDTVTHADGVVGTPPYMAPEQHLGEEVDASCDQYGFCVALWEALYGLVPFSGSDLRTLFKAKATGAPRLPRADPAVAKVPRWLRELVQRGLAPKREDRFGSMAELLAAIERGLGRQRRRRWQLALGGLTTAAVIAVAWPRPAEPLCQGATTKLEGVWDPATKIVVRDAVLATETVYAQATWERLEPQLDDYAARWSAGHTEACEATHVRGEQTEQRLDARMRCLDRSLAELRATVQTLQRANAGVVEHAIGAVGALPELDACVDPQRMDEPMQGDPQVLAALEDQLAEARARERVGDFEGGLRVATEALAQADAQGLGPMAARCALQVGVLLHRLDRNDDAVEPLQRAFFEGQRHGLDGLQIDAATSLTSVMGTGQNKIEEAQTWVKHAEAGIARLDDAERQANLRSIQGTLHVVAGEYEAALEDHREALALHEARFEPDDPRIASVLNGLGIAYWHHGDYEQALQTHQRARSIWEQALGPDHPVVALSLTNLGNTYAMLERYEPAQEVYTRAADIREATLGPEHPRLAGTLANLANIYNIQKKPTKALELLERATAILEKAYGSEHPSLLHPLIASATAYDTLGRYEQAIATQERAIAIFERTVGPDHPELGTPLTNLGVSLLALDRLDEAQPVLERALAIRERALGEDHPDVAMTQSPLGHLLLERGLHREALAMLERALAVIERSHGAEHPSIIAPMVDKGLALYELGDLSQAREVLERARTRLEHEDEASAPTRAAADFGLARVLDGLGEDPERALELARHARRTLQRAPGKHRKQRAEIDAWLRER